MPRILLLRTAGTNCDRELDHAFTLAGGSVDALHINALLQNPAQLHEYQILALPGGFSYGDDIASGKILANQLIHHLQAPLRTFINDGNLILGVCNGFQVLVKSGLLPGPHKPAVSDGAGQTSTQNSELRTQNSVTTTLTYNTSGRFEDRWVKIKVVSRNSPWLPSQGTILDVPIAHGEGRFVTRDTAILEALKANDQIAFQYVDDAGNLATTYPALPNGSQQAIAGITDTTGRVLGLMPHPERIVHPENHPLFTRGGGKADGLMVFESAMKYLKSREAVSV